MSHEDRLSWNYECAHRSGALWMRRAARSPAINTSGGICPEDVLRMPIPPRPSAKLAPTAPTPAAEQTKVVSTKPAPPTAKGETKTTDGGVKYETLKEGSGPELKPGQRAEIHYVGTLDDGDVFDSSRTKTHPSLSR